MNGFGFFYALRIFIILGVIVLVAMAAFIGTIWGELAMEANYRHRFGGRWQVEFENDHGSLTQAHTRIACASVGAVAIPGILLMFYRAVRPNSQPRRGGRTRGQRKQQRHESPVERVVRCRRNAVLGNFFGVAGILAGLMLVIFRFGSFEDHDNEMALGMLVFLAGYCSVVRGCWWWLKAKAWPEAAIFIAFMPMAVFFLPFVRLILFANPAILFLSMIMMPLILIVVVFVLPDKSGVARRQPVRDWAQLNRSAQAGKSGPGTLDQP